VIGVGVVVVYNLCNKNKEERISVISYEAKCGVVRVFVVWCVRTQHMVCVVSQ